MSANVNIAAELAARQSQIDAALAAARAKWNGWEVKMASWAGGADPAQVLGVLNNIETAGIARWKKLGEEYSRTPDAIPQAKLDGWIDLGNELVKQIASIGEMSELSSLSRIVTDTVQATAEDVGKVAKKVANTAGGALVWWAEHGKTVLWSIAGLGALFIAWKVYRTVT